MSNRNRRKNDDKKYTSLEPTKIHKTRSFSKQIRYALNKTKEFENLLPSIKENLLEGDKIKYVSTKYTHTQYAKPSLQKLKLTCKKPHY